jgi:glutamate transport system permease protein
MYAVAAVIFIVINYALSKLAVYVQRRVALGRKTAAPPVAQGPIDTMGGVPAVAAEGRGDAVT